MNDKLTRIEIFYDGNFFHVVSNYEQCSLLGLHSVPASPWETLMNRIVGTCELNPFLG